MAQCMLLNLRKTKVAFEPLKIASMRFDKTTLRSNSVGRVASIELLFVLLVTACVISSLQSKLSALCP